jgi:hypothetical protein
MNEIVIKTQKEFDGIKSDFCGTIRIQDTTGYVSVNRSFDKAEIRVSGNATIKSVYGNATIKSVSGNATIEFVYDNATIEFVYDNATIKSVYDNATIKSVYGNATIKSVSGNATILLITMFATICALYGANKICAKGNVIIRSFCSLRIEKTKSVTVVKQSTNLFKKVSVSEYTDIFPVHTKGDKVILYKAVHKRDNKYFADYDKNYEYIIGVNVAKEFDDSKEKSCTKGIHVAHKLWAIRFGSWDDVAILECEVDKKDIVVAKDCDGKVRARKINIIRELPKTEY